MNSSVTWNLTLLGLITIRCSRKELGIPSKEESRPGMARVSSGNRTSVGHDTEHKRISLRASNIARACRTRTVSATWKGHHLILSVIWKTKHELTLVKCVQTKCTSHFLQSTCPVRLRRVLFFATQRRKKDMMVARCLLIFFSFQSFLIGKPFLS